MKLNAIFRFFLGSLALAMSLLAPAQELAFGDLFNGEKLPGMLKLDDITSEYRALKLTVAGGNAGGDSMSALLPLMMLSSSRGNSTQPAAPDIYSLIGTYWTTGKIAQIKGEEFLITYKLEMGFMPVTGMQSPVNVSLRLNLVKANMISSISPMPDVTKERLMKGLLEAKISFNNSAAIDIAPESATTAAILMPVFSQAKQAATQTASLSNSKQVALSLLMYCGDYDDVMPYAQSTGAVVKATYPYAKNLDIWWTPDGRRFLFNMSLSGVSMTSIESPAETILVYADKPNANGSREVAFTDGHAKSLSAAEWNRYLPTLKLKLRRDAKKPLPKEYGSEFNRSTPPPGGGRGGGF